jgi:hypothetical protein
VIVTGAQIRGNFAMYYDLGPLVGCGLQEYWIKVGMRLQTCRKRLKGLGSANFAPILSYGRIQSHILWFERGYAHTIALQDSAKAGN